MALDALMTPDATDLLTARFGSARIASGTKDPWNTATLSPSSNETDSDVAASPRAPGAAPDSPEFDRHRSNRRRLSVFSTAPGEDGHPPASPVAGSPSPVIIPRTPSPTSRRKSRIPYTMPESAVSLVFTDVQNSTHLWEFQEMAMTVGLELHNLLLRKLLKKYKGYEVKTEGDAFFVTFSSAANAVQWCLNSQVELLTVDWPHELLTMADAAEVPRETADGSVAYLWRGLRVRMGMHHGKPLLRSDPTTRRMDYFGPQVNLAARVGGCARGGQVVLSSAAFACVVASDVVDMTTMPLGEHRLKGIRNAELLYQVVPTCLAGRVFQVPTDSETDDRFEHWLNRHDQAINNLRKQKQSTLFSLENAKRKAVNEIHYLSQKVVKLETQLAESTAKIAHYQTVCHEQGSQIESLTLAADQFEAKLLESQKRENELRSTNIELMYRLVENGGEGTSPAVASSGGDSRIMIDVLRLYVVPKLHAIAARWLHQTNDPVVPTQPPVVPSGFAPSLRAYLQQEDMLFRLSVDLQQVLHTVDSLLTQLDDVGPQKNFPPPTPSVVAPTPKTRASPPADEHLAADVVPFAAKKDDLLQLLSRIPPEDYVIAKSWTGDPPAPAPDPGGGKGGLLSRLRKSPSMHHAPHRPPFRPPSGGSMGPRSHIKYNFLRI